MALISGVIGLLGRFAGRLLNTTLGWATILLFGKVAQSRQVLLLVMVVGSLAWVAAVVGVLVPQVGALLITAIPTPDFIEVEWIRVAMLLAALILPPGVGVAAVFVTPAAQRGSPRDMAVNVVRGYPFTFVLALTIVVLAVIATVRKARSLARRWEDAHVPVIVKPGAYETVLARLRSVLAGAGLELEIRKAPTSMSAPARLLNAVAGRGLGELVPDELKLLQSPDLEVLVYPSDLAISGTRERVALARATIASTLTGAAAYLTTTAEAQAVEDRIQRLAEKQEATGTGDGRVRSAERIEQVRNLDSELVSLTIPFEEWETLYRQRLQVERDLLRDGNEDGNANGSDGGAGGGPGPESRRRAGKLDVGVAAVGLGLVALDIAMLMGRRRDESRRRR